MILLEILSQKTLLAGILPLINAKHTAFLHNEVTGVFIPDEARKIKNGATSDTESGIKVGVELAVELIQQIKSWASGVYIMPQFHRYDMIAEIIENTL